MKSIFSIILAILALVTILPVSVSGANEKNKAILLEKYTLQLGDVRDIDPQGNRMPSRPIICTLTPYGISLSESMPIDIVMYEIWSTSDNTIIASFNQEKEFIDYIFNTPATSELQIRLITSEYQLIGNLTN